MTEAEETEETQATAALGKSRRGKRQQQVHPIETANKKSDEDFVKEYLDTNDNSNWTKWRHPTTQAEYTLSLSTPSNLSAAELDACFELVEETSGADYRNSSFGWHVSHKKKEMRSPDLRYILVKKEADGDGDISGFTSLMPTFENHEAVVYCYEIHLKEHLQGTGLGRKLMTHLMDVAENIPSVEKVMLTCFISNASGIKFYEKLGFVEDDYSPRERKLRGGKVVKPDYVILSRRTSKSAGPRRPC